MDLRLLPILLLTLAASIACEPLVTGDDDDDSADQLETTLLTITPDADGEAWISLREGRVLGPDEVDGDNWDLHLEGWNLFLNGGASGEGEGAGIPFRELDPDLGFAQVNAEQDILYFLFQDDYGSVLSNWWAYGLRGDHLLYSRFHRYLLHEPTPEGEIWWKLQILGYYDLIDGAPEAAHVSIRWQQLSPEPGLVRSTIVDATAGGIAASASDPLNHFAYLDLQSGEVLPYDDEQARTADDWDIGFRRFYVRLNGGTSGPAGIAAFDADAEIEETDATILALDADSTLTGFETLSALPQPEQLRQDEITPILLGWYRGNPGAGAVVDDQPFLASTADDSARAKLRVVEVVDGDAAAPESIVLEFALLP